MNRSARVVAALAVLLLGLLTAEAMRGGGGLPPEKPDVLYFQQTFPVGAVVRDNIYDYRRLDPSDDWNVRVTFTPNEKTTVFDERELDDIWSSVTAAARTGILPEQGKKIVTGKLTGSNFSKGEVERLYKAQIGKVLENSGVDYDFAVTAVKPTGDPTVKPTPVPAN